jgi:hypothetical protein
VACEQEPNGAKHACVGPLATPHQATTLSPPWASQAPGPGQRGAGPPGSLRGSSLELDPRCRWGGCSVLGEGSGKTGKGGFDLGGKAWGLEKCQSPEEILAGTLRCPLLAFEGLAAFLQEPASLPLVGEEEEPGPGGDLAVCPLGSPRKKVETQGGRSPETISDFAPESLLSPGARAIQGPETESHCHRVVLDVLGSCRGCKSTCILDFGQLSTFQPQFLHQ